MQNDAGVVDSTRQNDSKTESASVTEHSETKLLFYWLHTSNFAVKRGEVQGVLCIEPFKISGVVGAQCL